MAPRQVLLFLGHKGGGSRMLLLGAWSGKPGEAAAQRCVTLADLMSRGGNKIIISPLQVLITPGGGRDSFCDPTVVQQRYGLAEVDDRPATGINRGVMCHSAAINVDSIEVARDLTDRATLDGG